MKILMTASLLILGSVSAAMGQDPGWPRQITKPGGTLIYYQPQADDWKGFTDLTWRMAFSLTPAGGRQVVGVVELEGHADVAALFRQVDVVLLPPDWSAAPLTG